MVRFNMQFEVEHSDFTVEFDGTSEWFDFGFGVIQTVDPSDIPIYDGEYVVVPKAYDDITLQTTGKKLIDDIVVLKIPYVESTNAAGGITVTIA